jgi:hypothetical protein
MKYVLAAILLLISATVASAQRCPAGQDQFHNCLSMNPQMRAKQEAWANQPAAYQIPGAQPLGATRSTAGSSMNPCVYRKAIALERARNPRYMRYKAAADRAGGTFEAGGTVIRSSPEFHALKRDLFRQCGARP